MTKHEVVTHLCATVGMAFYSRQRFEHAADCFCGHIQKFLGEPPDSWRFESDDLLAFIRQAVREKLQREGLTVVSDPDAD